MREGKNNNFFVCFFKKGKLSIKDGAIEPNAANPSYATEGTKNVSLYFAYDTFFLNNGHGNSKLLETIIHS